MGYAFADASRPSVAMVFTPVCLTRPTAEGALDQSHARVMSVLPLKGDIFRQCERQVR